MALILSYLSQSSVRLFVASECLAFAACTWAPGEVQQRLVAVLDRGVARPRYRNLPGSAVGARFPQLCLRKLYVVCSRGREPDGAQSCLHEVNNQITLPSGDANVCTACCMRCMYL